MLYTQESLEIITDLKNDVFACTCSSDSCAGDVCTRAADGQSCDLFSAYTSCWTEYPAGLVGETDYFFEPAGPGWLLKALTGPTETIAGESDMIQRKLTIENLKRDADGNIAETGTPDYNTKKIAVTVWYREKNTTHKINLQTILTAWENL